MSGGLSLGLLVQGLMKGFWMWDGAKLLELRTLGFRVLQFRV